MEFENNIKSKLLMRGFTEKQLLNNRGLIGAVIDETILLQTKNLIIPIVSRTFKEKNTLSFDNYLQDFYKGNNGIYREIGTDYYYSIEEIRLKHKKEFEVKP